MDKYPATIGRLPTTSCFLLREVAHPRAASHAGIKLDTRWLGQTVALIDSSIEQKLGLWSLCQLTHAIGRGGCSSVGAVTSRGYA
jgi:hypothetical protein